MTSNKVQVKVEWQGTKLFNLPTGLKYITVGKFDDNWLEDAWSIVLDFTIPPAEQGNPSFGLASFLMANAPGNKLKSGVMFELYEGKSLTAKVSII